MSTSEKVDKDAWRGDWLEDHGDLPIENKSSNYNEEQDMHEIAVAAAEEAIQRVLTSAQKVDVDAICEDIDGSHCSHQDVSNQGYAVENSSQTPINNPSKARKVSESEPDAIANDHFPTLVSQVRTSKQFDVSDDHASATMAASILGDKAIYNDMYGLMASNVVLWDIVFPELAEVRPCEQNDETLAMISKAYAHVEITFSKESSLVQLVPTPLQFRITSLDRCIPKKFEDFVFMQEMSDDGYIRKYGISASLYSADTSSRVRAELLHEFRSHLQRIQRCLVKAQHHLEEANKWNEYVGAIILEWVRQFPKSSTSSNFFIRQNIKQGDVHVLERILDDKKPDVVNRAVILNKLE